MYYVYVLKCNDKSFYVGYSADLKTRIKKHKKGGARSTKSKLPLELVYYEAYTAQKDARKREKSLKEHKPKSELKRQIMYSIGGGKPKVSGEARSRFA